MIEIFPDPGVLPKLAAPNPGEKIVIEVEGEPPYKDRHFSIRNPKHPKYGLFLKLRQEAIKAMAGRKWYDGPVKLILTYYSVELVRGLIEYMGGIMDTLDGSHGCEFTYLPIVYQDDCQVVECESKFIVSNETRYVLEAIFLGEKVGG